MLRPDPNFQAGIKDKTELKKIIDRIFLTTSGKHLAKKIYLSSGLSL